MTIKSIKEDLYNHIGDNALIKCNLGRNKIVEYNVVIKNLYEHIFLVEVDNKYIKSFSYSDIITKTIKIDYKKIAI